ncbi:hypothetical protein [Frigidibacter sp. SD6-1]|uniref:hypothetical protein n=1 Tax=Frigidibacter sp. SD6-1 TaxID=3032581 RepID=UPI0024DF3260|nr:hypothetical protein [Frigidibacter sp. SD6-1]
MDSVRSIDAQAIERAVHDALGAIRVRSVSSELRTNDDGAAIVRVRVVYDASQGMSVEDMDRTADAIWSQNDGAAPFPVIDFQADTDREFLAAE